MCVHDLVRLQAAANPRAVAIVHGDRTLTYAELDTRSNQLARVLRSHAVGPEVPVGLCMRRSAELIVSALAILKAGGAYLPIDPDYPKKRISMLLEDSGAPVVITDSSSVDNIPPGPWRTVLIDDAELESQPEDAVESSASAENLAYVIFTSGSTGRPKGVQITHANLLNLVAWHRRAFDVTASDRATLHASPGFDAAVWEIWPYLASGSSVHVVDEEVRTAAEPLRDWLLAKGITIGFLPTALAELLIELPWPRSAAMRLMLTGADTLRRYPRPDLPFALVNNYGPTECTVVVTSGRVSAEAQSRELPSIGRVIDNVQVHIVDEQLQPVVPGTPGELLVGGAGVGRGYINLPEKTAEKFVPDSFSREPGARLYRTGDRARMLPDGEIAFLGRMDEQVKIRGFRVEPQEISARLNEHHAIKDSFVSAHSNGSAELKLVAYVVPRESEIDVRELRHFLSQYVPDYMVPSAFVRLQQLPLTSHGKIDREALPIPTGGNVLNDTAFEIPRSGVEERVAYVVSRVLGVAEVGRDDNFFNLGGHSLMGAQIIAQLRDIFGVELSLRTLFDQPTVAEIALQVEQLIHTRLAAMPEEEVERLLAASGM
jgi:amino acid adenylation domain-containing protein